MSHHRLCAFLESPPTHYFGFVLLCSITVCVIWPPHTEPGLCLQLALKQLSPGVRVEPCSSAVLQFSVEEIGQLVPLLPNPCTPISTTRWQTEDLDGNKVLFQVSSAWNAPDVLISSCLKIVKKMKYKYISFCRRPNVLDLIVRLRLFNFMFYMQLNDWCCVFTLSHNHMLDRMEDKLPLHLCPFKS